MSLASLIKFALQASIFAIVFSLSLGVKPAEATWGLRHPRALVRAFVAMFVIMPLVAAGLSAGFHLRPAVKVALIALALSPVPPILPIKAMKAGGEASRAIGLLVAASLASPIVVTVGVPVIASWFGVRASVPPGAILRLDLITVLLPVLAGQLVRWISPTLGGRIAGPVGKAGFVLLLLGIAPILVKTAPAMWSLVGRGTLLALAAFVLVGLAVGHFLAGERPEDRTVLALSNGSRHPGIALTIASAAVPNPQLVAPAVVLYLLVSAILSALYMVWQRKRTR